jgi:membrane protein DedA with SNARE-associated domain
VTEALFELVPRYGAALIFAATFLSCLALPVPTSALMLAGGAFAASGDLVLGTLWAAAFLGAVLGDQTGFRLARRGRAGLERAMQGPRRAALMARADDLIDRRGGAAVFLTRWLFSPLGPYVNFAAGAAGMAALRFTVAGVAGEAVWVSVYIGLGYGFSGQIAAIADVLANSVAMLAGAAVTIALGLGLRRALRAEAAGDRPPGLSPPPAPPCPSPSAPPDPASPRGSRSSAPPGRSPG